MDRQIATPAASASDPPPPATPSPASVRLNTRVSKACRRCRRLRVKCINKGESDPPCDACRRAKQDCIFPRRGEVDYDRAYRHPRGRSSIASTASGAVTHRTQTALQQQHANSVNTPANQTPPASHDGTGATIIPVVSSPSVGGHTSATTTIPTTPAAAAAAPFTTHLNTITTPAAAAAAAAPTTTTSTGGGGTINILFPPPPPAPSSYLPTLHGSLPDWDSLPPYPEVVAGVRALTTSYFQLGFLPKSLFFDSLARDPRSATSVFLLLAILGVSARFTPCLVARFSSPNHNTNACSSPLAAAAPSSRSCPESEGGSESAAAASVPASPLAAGARGGGGGGGGGRGAGGVKSAGAGGGGGGGARATRHFLDLASHLVPQYLCHASLDAIQAFFLMSIAEWGDGDRNRSVVYMGIAVRLAGILRLHREDAYQLSSSSSPQCPPTREDIIASEVARRTFWMLETFENLHSGADSAVCFSYKDITVLLPCDEREFAFGVRPPRRAALRGTPPAAGAQGAVLQTLQDRSLFATLLQTHSLWGQVARRVSGGGGWSTATTSTDREGSGGGEYADEDDDGDDYQRLARALADFERDIPPQHAWSVWNLRGFKVEGLDLAYISVAMVLRLSNIILRRSYLHDIVGVGSGSSEQQQKQQHTTSLGQKPPSFWLPIASDLFSNMLVLDEQIAAFFEHRSPDQGYPALIVFCVYVCGSLANHLRHRPDMCPRVAADGHAERILASSVRGLAALQSAWPMARRWYVALWRAGRVPVGGGGGGESAATAVDHNQYQEQQAGDEGIMTGSRNAEIGLRGRRGDGEVSGNGGGLGGGGGGGGEGMTLDDPMQMTDDDAERDTAGDTRRGAATRQSGQWANMLATETGYGYYPEAAALGSTPEQFDMDVQFNAPLLSDSMFEAFDAYLWTDGIGDGAAAGFGEGVTETPWVA